MKDRNLGTARRAGLAVAAAVLAAAAGEGTPAAAAGAPSAACTPHTAYAVNNPVDDPGFIGFLPPGPGTVTPINTCTNKAGPAIPVGWGPEAIAITPNGATAYVANNWSGTVTPISTRTNKAGPAIPVEEYPVAIAITPNGATAYVANDDPGTVTPISTKTNKAGPQITVGFQPVVIAITPGKSLPVCPRGRRAETRGCRGRRA
ncbi:MAG: beta-propeller repeat protein [Actinomycetia bacterium]|nr:beta-propeller repeat protein [Actinomycetes bacterium]